jgi:hypothetical protein
MYGIKKRRRKERDYGEIPCVQCKKKFIKRRPHQQFRTDICRVHYHRKHAQRQPKLTLVKVRCEKCNTLFTKKAQWQKFCSERCRVSFFISQKKEKRGERVLLPKMMKQE